MLNLDCKLTSLCSTLHHRIHACDESSWQNSSITSNSKSAGKGENKSLYSAQTLRGQSTGVGRGLVRWWVMSKVITEISSLCLFSLLRHFALWVSGELFGRSRRVSPSHSPQGIFLKGCSSATVTGASPLPMLLGGQLWAGKYRNTVPTAVFFMNLSQTCVCVCVRKVFKTGWEEVLPSERGLAVFFCLELKQWVKMLKYLQNSKPDSKSICIMSNALFSF